MRKKKSACSVRNDGWAWAGCALRRRAAALRIFVAHKPTSRRVHVQPYVSPPHLNVKREKVRSSAYLPWACRKLGGYTSRCLAREQNLIIAEDP